MQFKPLSALVNPITLAAVLAIVSATGAKAAPLDFDRDGASDLTTVQIESNDSLSWHANGTQLTSAGENGDHVAIGRWMAGEESKVTFIQKSGTTLVWKLIFGEYTISKTLGASGDIAISGGDFDGNDRIDAAVVTPGSVLNWKIATDLFGSDSPTLLTVSHGRSKDLPLFINVDGSKDLPAVLHRPGIGNLALRTKDPVSSAVRQYRRIPRSLRNFGRPTPIQMPDGTDALLFTRKGSDTTVARVLRLNGRLIARAEYDAAVDMVVGDYVAEQAGEEFAFAGSTTWKLINPFSNYEADVSAPEGIAVDEININQFEGEDTSGLPAPRDTCYEQDPTDGYKVRFIWKPQSDTQFGSVVILPGTYLNKVDAVRTTTTEGSTIRTLTFKGNANPDVSGLRPHYIDRTMEGRSYRQQYGSIVVRVELTNGACLSYAISNPAQRTD